MKDHQLPKANRKTYDFFRLLEKRRKINLKNSNEKKNIKTMKTLLSGEDHENKNLL